MFHELEERFHELLERLRREPPPAAEQPAGRIIREVMDPDFLLHQLDAIERAGAARPGGNQLSADAYAKARAELAQAGAGAAGQAPGAATPAPGAAGQAPGAAAQGPGAPAQTPFMPSTAVNSNLQSVLTTCIETRFDDLLKALPEGPDRLWQAVLGDVEIFRKFGPCDPLWMETKLAEQLAQLDGRPAFPNTPAGPVALAADARVILVGDWATGLAGAQAVAAQIGARLDQGRGRAQHVIHLGDTYYSGWREEYETRYLPHWPVAREERDVLCWSLNGNHDMYSGGHGYFGYLLQDPRFRGHWLAGHSAPTPSSHFSLENEHWQVLGLDSAYDDHDLAGSQAQWVGDKLGAGRRTMLLTHHQPFSAYEAVTQKMTKKVAPLFDAAKPLDAWFWGHEHRCTVYGGGPEAPGRPVPWLRFGSCVGNGGVPQMLPDPPLPEGKRDVEGYAPLSWAYAGAEPAEGNQWLRFGFVVLDFDGPQVAVEYVDEHGNQAHRLVLG
ncbi:MAG TPA: metallophosphoesterase [Solirubrobacteraceae bacterium]|nr:metallophosphoesterase [Solirubrobacteraceae bacterium]